MEHQDLQDALETFGATFVGNLGVGGTAIVYDVLLRDIHYALKIVQLPNIARFEREISWLWWQKCQRNIENIAEIEASVYLPSGSLAALIHPVGYNIDNIDDTRTYLPEICKVLSALHRNLWRHGDARMPNFILVDCENEEDSGEMRKRVVLIDFGYILYCGDTIAVEVPYEMYRIAASFLGLTYSSDLDQDADDLLSSQTDHIDVIREAVGTYIHNEYTEAAALEFANALLDLE